jgi:hypothetical protein
LKRLSLILILFVVASAGSEILHYSRSLTEAFQAYQDQATTMAIEQRYNPRFEPLEGYILDVTYILQSIDYEGRNAVRLVAIQAVHFQKGLPTLNWWARKIAKTKHHALMTKAHGYWQISELQEDATEVTDLLDSIGTE